MIGKVSLVMILVPSRDTVDRYHDVKFGIDEALEIFKNILSCANHVGLLSEHVDIETRELMGNFPQAYSHLGLIKSVLPFHPAARRYYSNFTARGERSGFSPILWQSKEYRQLWP